MKRKLIIILIPILGFCFQSLAQGDLLITPPRVVFEGNKLKEALNLVNIGADTATYSISFLQYNMNEDGSFVIIEKPDSGQMFANPFLRIFPRKVTLAPGEPQVIMLQFRHKADMLSGEYRSHIYFRSEKNYKPLGTKKSDSDSMQLNVQLVPIFGISIPVIIRTGTLNSNATLSDLKIEVRQDNMHYIRLMLHRTGNISIYGNLSVEYIPVQGKPYIVGEVKGVGVYTNINKRDISIKLTKTPGLTFKNGKLKVRFTSPDDAKYIVYDEEEISLN